MDFDQQKRRFQDLWALLEEYREVWQKEILFCHCPDGQLARYPARELQQLLALSEEGLFQLEGRRSWAPLQASALRSFLQRLHSLCQLPQISYPDTHPDGGIFFGVKAKKRHEIIGVAHLLRSQAWHQQMREFVDVGGGVGHLSHFLAQELGVPGVCIDSNEMLLAKGKKRACQRLLKERASVRYLHHDAASPLATPYKRGRTFIGLHTCGELAAHFLHRAREGRAQSVIHFGCCYYKNQGGSYRPLSHRFSAYPFIFPQEALVLATRPNGPVSRRAFERKQRVKFFRYAFHHLLCHEYGRPIFQKLGASKPSSYDKMDFGEYAHKGLKRLGLAAPSCQALNDYFGQHFETVRRWVYGNALRNFFARPVELMLALDRAFYLQENGYQTQLLAAFQEELSPRNIALVATRPPFWNSPYSAPTPADCGPDRRQRPAQYPESQ